MNLKKCKKEFNYLYGSLNMRPKERTAKSFRKDKRYKRRMKQMIKEYYDRDILTTKIIEANGAHFIHKGGIHF